MSNVRDIYIPEKEGWGIEPNKAAQHHEEVKCNILERSLDDVGLQLGDIDLIAFSQGPGLSPCLHKGLDFVKELLEDNSIPVLGIAHTVSHIEIGKLETGSGDPIILYVSGGNTQVLGFSNGGYRVFGEVMDTPIGNGLDKFGRSVGIKFPAGPKIEEMAKRGNKYIKLPYSVKGMDMSFSGLVTEAERKYKAGEKLEDVCYSLQETAFAMLTEVVERAMAHTGKEEVLLTGGVAANERLQEMLNKMCEERDAKFYTVPMEYSGDNGAMIAYTGFLAYKCGKRHEIKNLEIKPNWRTDEVDVNWIS